MDESLTAEKFDLTECHARHEWALGHLRRLREAIEEYERSYPYTLRQDFDSVAYTSSVYITPERVPMQISFMAGDVVHNLRSTLDHLAWKFALAIDNRPPVFPLGNDPDSKSWRDVLFPLWSREDDSGLSLPKRLMGLSDEVKAFLADIQPYSAADDPRDSTVWKFHQLSLADKHRVPLLAVPSLHETETLTVTTPLSRVNSRILYLARVPLMLEGETLLVRVGYDTVPLSKPDVQVKHGIRVAFHDSLGIGPGMWVYDMLDIMASMVEYILTRAEQLSTKGGI